MNMKRLSPRWPSLVSTKRLLIVSRLSVGTLCTMFKAFHCLHQKEIFSKSEHHRKSNGPKRQSINKCGEMWKVISLDTVIEVYSMNGRSHTTLKIIYGIREMFSNEICIVELLGYGRPWVDNTAHCWHTMHWSLVDTHCYNSVLRPQTSENWESRAAKRRPTPGDVSVRTPRLHQASFDSYCKHH